MDELSWHAVQGNYETRIAGNIPLLKLWDSAAFSAWTRKKTSHWHRCISFSEAFRDPVRSSLFLCILRNHAYRIASPSVQSVWSRAATARWFSKQSSVLIPYFLNFLHIKALDRIPIYYHILSIRKHNGYTLGTHYMYIYIYINLSIYLSMYILSHFTWILFVYHTILINITCKKTLLIKLAIAVATIWDIWDPPQNAWLVAQQGFLGDELTTSVGWTYFIWDRMLNIIIHV